MWETSSGYDWRRVGDKDNQSQYKGQVKKKFILFGEESPNGKGGLTYRNGKWDGDKYVGEFKDDEYHGQGIYTYSSGKKYEGEFKDGNFDGQGTETLLDGQKYVGEWKDDKKWNGTVYNKDGSILSVISEGEKTSPKTQAEETPAEVPSEGSSAEIRAQIAALTAKLEETEAREKAQAAEQEATSPVTEETEGTVAAETEPVDTAPEEITPSATEASTAAAETSDVADTVVEKTITYNLKGKDTQTYTIKGSKIFNKNNVEVFKEDSVDRNKIFANLAVKEGRAQLVEHDKKKYVVNDKQQIMSVTTGQIMRWAENHGSRKAILSKLQPIQQPVQESSEVSYKLNNNFNLLESELDVHTLSVLFPAAINADGTLRTGDTADKAINKLGKFLKVCS